MNDAELQELIKLDRQKTRERWEQERAHEIFDKGMTPVQAAAYLHGINTPDRATDYRA